MAQTFETLADFHNHGFDDIIDVRSPDEFAEDHIPGAINLPVLSNEERAQVGTIYKQDNAFTAKKVGAALVARNSAKHLDGSLAEKDGSWRPLVYCWRGGQRSGSFATILKQIGWRADTITGGYQTYRRLVARSLHDQPLLHRLIILEGNTGTAKTELLQMLSVRGQQVIDLEKLANHRGSVFGGVDQPQPSQKYFEGMLARELRGHDPQKPLLVEAESSKIGRLILPPSLWQAMKTAPRIRLTASLAGRAEYLQRTYADIASDAHQLSARLAALIPHQGREKVEYWQGLVAAGELLPLAAELMQFHYDPSYGRSRAAHAQKVVAVVAIESLEPAGLAVVVEKLADVIAVLAEPEAV